MFIFNSTNRSEPVFLAPFRLYCKLVRKPGQGCSSAPWAPCRMQPSYRTFTVPHGVWFRRTGFHSKAAATGSLLGGQTSAGGTVFLYLSPSGHNEDFDFFYFGLKCRKAKSGALSKTVAVPIEDTRGNPSHSNHSATSSQDECCSSLMSAAPAHFNVVLTAFRLWLV